MQAGVGIAAPRPHEPAPAAAHPVISPEPVEPAHLPEPEPIAAVEEAASAPKRPRAIRGPLIVLGLILLVLLLGGAISLIAFGPNQVATGLGLSERRVPLGIAITKQPDWRMIAGGSELFAVSGRIWNPTQSEQAVPDIRAELKDAKGRTVYAWTITRPQARLGAGKSVDFDAAAVDVPRASSKVAVSFVGTNGN